MDKIERQVTDKLLNSISFSLFLLSILTLLYTRHESRWQKARTEREMNVALKNANDRLEAQVQERTQRLSVANMKLTTEIAERKQTALELEESQDQLVQAAKMSALGQMATSITHELTQPLTAIRTFADNGQVYLHRNNVAEAASNLDLIANLADRMKDIIMHLKSYARKTPMTMESVSVDNVLQETLLVLTSVIENADAAIFINNDTPGLCVMAEPVRLQQVLTNLIQNALDSLTEVGKRDISITISESGGYVKIEVLDSGTGIQREVLDNLFDPFYTTKKVGSGLGLGLSISQGIVQAFGGTLSAQNADSGGALLTVMLHSARAKNEVAP